MKAYHYTTVDGWEKMNEGDRDFMFWDPTNRKYVDGKNVRGLWPHRRLIPQGLESSLTPSDSTEPHIFAMPTTLPETWLKCEEFPDIFRRLISGIVSKSDRRSNQRALTLIEINLLPTDKPYVVDYVHVVRGGDNSTRTNDQTHLIKGYKKYWESRIPLETYQGEYLLPEVIFLGPIPLERLNKLWEKEYDKFVEEQGLVRVMEWKCD